MMKNTAKEMIAWMEKQPPEVRDEFTKRELEKTEEEYSDFKNKFEKGLCYLCGSPIRTFHINKPCLHWFLKPKGIKKKHFEEHIPDICSRVGFVRTNTYLRWVANLDSPMKNINDIDSEDDSKVIEETIRYKNMRWSFSCAKSDLEGHKNANQGSYPHYHIGIWQEEHCFIKFNDLHLPFTEEDSLWFELQDGAHPFIKVNRSYAEGMKHLFEWAEKEENQESFLKNWGTSGDRDAAAVSMDTIIMAPEGETLAGEDIYNAIQKSKEEGTSIAYQLTKSEKFKNANIRMLATPGDGVPELTKRTKRNKNAKSK